MKPFGAYVHARPDGRIFYVGKGKEKRAHHLKRNAHHLNIVRKYGTENICVGFIPCSSEAIAFDLEIGLIKCLRRSGVQIVNLTDGGEGASGRTITPEFRTKMSRAANARSDETKGKLREAAKRQWLSEEHREHMTAVLSGRKHPDVTRAKMKGRVFSEEHRARLKASHKGMQGKTFSPETRLKMSASAKQRWANRKAK